MTISVNETKQYTVLLEEILFGCYLTLLGSVHVVSKWGGLKPSDNISHGHSHSMVVSM